MWTDGSTDDSVQILKEYDKKITRIKVLSQKNAGAGAARNLGLRHASGKYLSFLDSDDFFEPDMLETAYEQAERYQAEMVVFRSNQYLTEKDEYKETPWTLRMRSFHHMHRLDADR